MFIIHISSLKKNTLGDHILKSSNKRDTTGSTLTSRNRILRPASMAHTHRKHIAASNSATNGQSSPRSRQNGDNAPAVKRPGTHPIPHTHACKHAAPVLSSSSSVVVAVVALKANKHIRSRTILQYVHHPWYFFYPGTWQPKSNRK